MSTEPLSAAGAVPWVTVSNSKAAQTLDHGQRSSGSIGGTMHSTGPTRKEGQ